MKLLASDISDFAILRNEVDNYLYVDKTEYIWKLVSRQGGKYFLSRPRRFGKTLTVSLLEYFFCGRLELFKGLAIDAKGYDWPQYPVIHFDMGGFTYNSVQDLEDALCELVRESARKCMVDVESANATIMLRRLLNQLVANHQKLVFLVDEYDKPILRNLDQNYVSDIQSRLRDFYGVIKSFESAWRFVFITGVANFSRTSCFSDLNNLMDISVENDYATMLGYTQAELEENFTEHIDLAGRIRQESRKELLAGIKQWYAGFRFHPLAPSVYNPVSVAQFFSKGYEFNHYWSDTGTPFFSSIR